MTTHIDDVLEEFYIFKSNEGCSTSTIKWYKVHASQFIKHMNIRELNEWTPLAISKFLHLKQNTCTSGGLFMYYRVLRGISKWLYLHEFLSKDITPRIPKPKHHYEQKEGFSLQDVRDILRAAKRSYYSDFNVAMVVLFYDTGIRAGELCSLKLTDINWLQREITVTGKMGRRTAPVGRTALRKLKRYIHKARRAPHEVQEVFVNRNGKPLHTAYVTQKVKRLCKMAGIDKDKYTGPHAFRHGFAVQYLRNGGNLMHLKDTLGHRDITMTQRYVKLVGRDLQEEHRKFSPVEQMSEL